MVAQLEQGIMAARKGNNGEAKTLLTQVLKENNQNEQAWLWLSEVVDTIGEQISCVEQVLLINPANKTAKLALQKLKSQPPQRLAAPPKSDTAPLAGITSSPKSLSNGVRKPFRLAEMPPPTMEGEHLHHEVTVPLPPTPTIDNREQDEAQLDEAFLKQASAATQSHPAIKRPLNRPQPAKPTDPDNFPLLPVILFGTLSVTAVGGLVMIMLLLFFN